MRYAVFGQIEPGSNVWIAYAPTAYRAAEVALRYLDTYPLTMVFTNGKVLGRLVAEFTA